MADFIACTASNAARISRHNTVHSILNRFYVDPGEGDTIDCLEQDGAHWTVGFWSYGWFGVQPKDTHGAIDWETDATDDLLKALQPYLREPLVIQSIGHEKLRFPLCAMQIVVPPNGDILYSQLDGQPTLTQLVSFTYDNGDTFLERVALSPAELRRIQRLLGQANAQGEIKSDFYVGPEQTRPTPFDDLYPRLRDALGLSRQPSGAASAR